MTATTQPAWESYAPHTERLAVPGGHLYRTCSWVEHPTGSDEPNRGYWQWSDPVFVQSSGDEVRIADGSLTDRERSLIADGRRIDCVRSISARTGFGLAEARRYMDRAIGGQP